VSYELNGTGWRCRRVCTSCRELELNAGDGVGTLKTCVRCREIKLDAVNIPFVLVNHMGHRRRAGSAKQSHKASGCPIGCKGRAEMCHSVI
jgi:hypothetical protein